MNRRDFIRNCGLASASLMVGDAAHAMNSSEWKRSPYIKPIMGTWFEFFHGNQLAGKYWNPQLPKFTESQWREKIKEISETGMQYLVLMSVAYGGKTFYPSKLASRHDYVCDDPLETVLSAADEYGLKFFVSNDFWGDWSSVGNMMTNIDIAKLREDSMAEIAEKYSHHKSFYGWYYPNETGIWDHFEDVAVNYVNRCTKVAKELMPHSVNLIAPYGTLSTRFEGNQYAKQLEKLDIDIVAYQDEVGVRKVKAGCAGKHYEELYKVHAKVGRSRLWADIEIFDFEGEVYKSAGIPADFCRVLKQIEDVSPFVEHILVYQYQGMMNKPRTSAYCGHPRSEKLYTDYMNWLKIQR